MNFSPPQILFEDNHLLALNKPAGQLTMGDDTGDVTMVDVARDYLRVKYNKPGNVFVGVVHRLDRPVSGVLLFARTSKAAARLSDQFRRGTVRKIYRAVVEGRSAADRKELTDWLLKDRTTNVVGVVSPSTPGAQKCVLQYQVAERHGDLLHLDVEPLTGRSHQIRVQLSHAGMPICGDGKYGSRQRLGARIRLHAHTLELQHPTRQETLRILAPIPSDFD
ncbi:MAG: RluA family pseudouridine synthase [Planctomycetaceae bacterium]